jgi:hypothetical protein
MRKRVPSRDNILLMPLQRVCWSLSAFLVSSDHTQSVRLLGRRTSLTQGLYLHTGQHKRRTKARNHLYPKWDSNL